MEVWGVGRHIRGMGMVGGREASYPLPGDDLRTLEGETL